jgi:hypothetical protein
MRVLPTARTIAAVAFATLAWSARAEAQHPAPLGVVREYDGGHSTETFPVAVSPLAIVRTYEESDAASRAPDSPPSMAPWESTLPRTPTRLAIVTVFDGDDDAPATRHAPLMLLTYEGAEVVRSVRDPAVHLLSMVTDFDGHAPSVMAARVYIAYDERGGVVRVETALPPVNVITSGAPEDGPVVTMGRVITSTRTAVIRRGPRDRVRRPPATVNPPR